MICNCFKQSSQLNKRDKKDLNIIINQILNSNEKNKDKINKIISGLAFITSGNKSDIKNIILENCISEHLKKKLVVAFNSS